MQTLEFKNISKYFPGVKALDNVSFSIQHGECHALVGENGAGKSTLGKILAGIYQADEGEISIDGKNVSIVSPHDARAHGISIVHQELLFCPNLSVAENLFLGNIPGKMGFMDRNALAEKAKDVLGVIGLTLDVRQTMENLSIAQKQMVQIASAVASGAELVIMDEPTSSITQDETEKLFELIKQLQSRGVTLIYVSHRFEEIFRITDRITVLRDGKYVGTVNTRETSEDDIVRMMVGRSIDKFFPSHIESKLGAEILRVENLSLPGKFQNISFSLRAGEILGLAGLVGAGRSEIARAIFGLEPDATGTIFVEGKKANIRSASDAISCGIGLVPEDRKLQGLVLEMLAGENVSLAVLPRLQSAGFVKRREEQKLWSDYFGKLSVKPQEPRRSVATFSGGNQQKVVLAKWLSTNCNVLIVDEPTRGIDVNAKREIYLLIDELALSGKAILLISSELPELINLSTRILVLKQGNLMGEVSHSSANQETLMRLMAGIK